MTDIEIVGSGPNGLAAAVTLARAGLSVRVYERMAGIGGGASTRESVASGYWHDSCSAVHPLALASPFFRAFGLASRVEFVTPEVSFAHPLPAAVGGSGIAYRNLDRTVDALGADGPAYRRLLEPLAAHAREIARFTGSSLLRVPPHPVVEARFGLRTLAQGGPLWNAGFHGRVAPAMITGVAAHAIVPQPSPVAAAAGLALQTHAHAGGWPIPIGGSQAISDALTADLLAHGGEIVTDHEVGSLDELTARAGTVHIGGTREQIAAAERDVLAGRHAASPYVLVSQPSVFDASRAPAGGHALWTYTHVPIGSTLDQTEAVTRAIEQHAPGFRDLIVASRARTAAELAEYNPNYVGGDIAAGAATLGQLLARPVLSLDPWRTPMPGVYLTGASTVPGPGVHGQSGWFAARSVLRHEFGVRRTPSLAP